MYKVASDSRQRALHQGKPTDWVNGAERLSPSEQLRQLQDAIKILEGRILASSGAERKLLGQQKLELQEQISAFRKSNHLERLQKDGIADSFMDCAREMLSPLQFKIIYAAADRELKLRKARAQFSGGTCSGGE